MDSLKSKTPSELRQMLKELGAPAVRGRASVATLIKAVKAAQNHEIDQTPTGITEVPKGEDAPKPLSEYVQLPKQIKAPASMPYMASTVTPAKVATLGCSHEQVTEAVKNFTAKGMTIKFVDNCFEFHFKDRMDSGNLQQPIQHIVKAAEMVCRPALSADRVFLKPHGVV
jgi:hypothetical protein